MVSRVATCEGASSSVQIATLQAFPTFLFTILLATIILSRNVNLVKESLLNVTVLAIVVLNSKWRRLHYNEDKDAVFCYVCVCTEVAVILHLSVEISVTGRMAV